MVPWYHEAMKDDDREIVCSLLAGTLPEAGFEHEQHVRAAWAMLGMLGLEATIQQFPIAIRRLAENLGVPDKYHATITLAFVLIIDERRRAAPDLTWSSFAEANPDLLVWNPSVLEQYYTPQRLWSSEARQYFVLPESRFIKVTHA